MTPTPFSESRDFIWNVETLVSKTMRFTYYVGEGPLYWFRIEWAAMDPSCIVYPCQEIAPTISYIAPNCPYEIIENCIIMGPTCGCEISCTPGTCNKTTTEIWHMLATSVTHLCERINQECCNTKPTSGRMKSVKQYMRPALCCDVGGGGDKYVDVNFLKCECGNLVHPCVGTIIYPCHVNRCGIFGPAYSGGPVPPINEIKLAPDILGHMPMSIMTQIVSTKPEMQLVPPKEIQPRVVNKYGTSIPELIHCNHNLSNVLSDFFKSHKIKFDNMDLFYNKESNSWYGSRSFKEWKFSIEWIPQNSTKNYKLNISIDKGGKKSKLSLTVKNDAFFNKGNFEIICNYNYSNGNLDKSVLQSKLIKDDLGLFKNNSLKITLKG